MKKTPVLDIVLIIVLIILIVTLLFHLLYFNSFHKDLRPITDAEKQKVIDILNKSMNLTDYQIKFGRVYITKKTELAQIELTKNNSTKEYFIDMNKERPIKK